MTETKETTLGDVMFAVVHAGNLLCSLQRSARLDARDNASVEDAVRRLDEARDFLNTILTTRP